MWNVSGPIQMLFLHATALIYTAIALAEHQHSASSATEASASVSMKDLVDAVSQPHEASPLPSVPSRWNFAHYPKPSLQKGRLDRGFGSGYTRFNPWNHIDSVKGEAPKNAYVEMGDLHLAVYEGGKWYEHHVGPPCIAYTYDFGKIAARRDKRVAECKNGYAYAGIGFRNWSDPKRHTHGWSPKPQAQHNAEAIRYIMIWGTAKMGKIDPSQQADLEGGHYQYGVGADKRTPSTKGVIPPAAHGRRR
jgi:hypothetical protein